MSELVEYKGNSLAVVEEPGSLATVEEPGGLAAHGGGDGGADAAGGHPGGAFASPARHSRMAVAVVAASILAAVAVGAAVIGDGTSGSTGNGSAAAHGTLAASASNSAAAPSVDFTLSATQTGAGSQSTLLTGNGSFDLAHGVGQMTATIPALSSIVGGGTSDSVTLISDGTNLYLNLPALSSFLHGTTWFETSLAGFGSLNTGSSGSLSLSALADPAKVLAFLGSYGGTVTKVGSVDLQGVPTTEYRTTISLASVATHLQNGSQTSASGAVGPGAKALQQLGSTTVPVMVWIGTDGYLRQVSVTVDTSHATIGGILGDVTSSSLSGSSNSQSHSTTTVTVGLSNYGTPVSVTAPPASEVTNLDGAASSLRGAASKLGGALSGIVAKV
jgi:hypothetical protein